MMTYRQRSHRNSLFTRFFRVSHKSSKSLYVVPHQSNLLHWVQLHHPHSSFTYFCNLLGLNRYPLRLNHCLLRLNQYLLNHYLLRLNCQDHDEEHPDPYRACCCCCTVPQFDQDLCLAHIPQNPIFFSTTKDPEITLISSFQHPFASVSLSISFQQEPKK